MPERSSPELPVGAEATVFQRAGGELQQRAEAELPVGASPELPTSAKRAVPGCGASVYRRQVEGPYQALSGSWVHLFVNQNMVNPSDFTSSDRRSIGNVVLGGLHQ